MGENWISAPVWDEWRDLTRLQWSGRIAFEAEQTRWRNEGRMESGDISVSIEDCGGSYETSLENHMKTIENTSLFCSLIFLRSYALMESHAKLTMFIVDNGRWDLLAREPSELEKETIGTIHLAGGIEQWANALVAKCGQDWADVYGGKAGLVEMSVIRNAMMHGYCHVSAHLLEKAARRGCGLPYEVGDPVRVDFCRLHEYRGRIRSFCRVTADGVVHFHRGTHRNAAET